MLAAVLLSVLGVSERDIVEDYALTDRYFIAAERQAPVGYGSGDLTGAPPPELLKSTPESMESFLRKVENAYGSFRAFLMANGVIESDILGLQESMVSPTGTA